MNIIRISSLNTNYIWILYKNNECILIDPGETAKTLHTLKKYRLTVHAILLTHDHSDHTAGVHTIIQHYPKTIVYGPLETKKRGTNIVVTEGDSFTILKKIFTVLYLPGHTSGHIGFYSDPWLFCGDTVFSAGCGTFKKELAKSMYESFLKIKTLPINTLIFSGHEYTLSNVNFAISILPKDKSIINYYNKVVTLRKNKVPTIPTTLKLELKINIFFRCHDTNVKKALQLSPDIQEEWTIFHTLRNMKDLFLLYAIYTINIVSNIYCY